MCASFDTQRCLPRCFSATRFALLLLLLLLLLPLLLLLLLLLLHRETPKQSSQWPVATLARFSDLYAKHAA